LLSKIDYAVLKATTVPELVLKSAEETKSFGFATLCVFPKYVELARTVLPQEKVCAVVAFPLSAVPLALKLKEVEYAVESGAGELDVVVNLGAVKEGNWREVEQELKEIRRVASGAVLKLIAECCYLRESEKKTLCLLAVDNGWDYLKTSTGYRSCGATPEDVKFLVSCLEGKAKVKASGGIRDLESVKRFLSLGADRVGTSSARSIAEEVLHSWKV